MYSGSANKEWRRNIDLRHSFDLYLFYRTDTPVNLYLVFLGCST